MTPSANPPGPLAKILAAIILALLLGLGFMFSLVLLALIPFIALAVWAWFWWKTRELRKLMREQGPGFSMGGQSMGGAPMRGEVIDGEAVVIRENEASDADESSAASDAREPRLLPRDDRKP